jgi:hypothetical protein
VFEICLLLMVVCSELLLKTLALLLEVGISPSGKSYYRARADVSAVAFFAASKNCNITAAAADMGWGRSLILIWSGSGSRLTLWGLMGQ